MMQSAHNHAFNLFVYIQSVYIIIILKLIIHLLIKFYKYSFNIFI